MMWLKNVRMAPKLIGSFVLVAALAGVVGGVGVIGMDSMQSRMDQISGVNTPNLVYLLQVKDGIDAEMRATRGEILADTPAKIKDLAGDAEAARVDRLERSDRHPVVRDQQRCGAFSD